jgi:3-oxoacyl-[acyl-carrier-protein] synthase-3
MLATKLHADGSHGHILCVPGSVNNGTAAGSAYLYMDGPAVFKLAVSLLDKVAREALEAARMQSTEIDWLVPHQANIRIMQGTAKKMGLPLERWWSPWPSTATPRPPRFRWRWTRRCAMAASSRATPS